MALRALLWDFDDTLVPIHTLDRWQWAWKPQGPRLNERHARASIREGLRRWDRRRWQGLVGETGPADSAAYHDALREMLFAIAGRPLPEAETEAVLARFPKYPGPISPFPDLHPCLDTLRARGIRMGVLIGTPFPRARELLGQLRLTDLVTGVFGDVAGEPQAPAAAAYRAACDRLDAQPAETGFVGDLFWSDSRAASRAGLQGILLDRNDWWARLESVRVTSLADVPGLVDSSEPSPAAEPPTVPPPGP